MVQFSGSICPPRFAKWIDTSNTECIFTLEQKKNFKRPHLMPCPWYIELVCTENCLSKEASLKASCKQQVLVEANSGARVEANVKIPNDGLIERDSGEEQRCSEIGKAPGKGEGKGRQKTRKGAKTGGTQKGSHPFRPLLPHLLFVFIACCLRFAIALRE